MLRHKDEKATVVAWTPPGSGSDGDNVFAPIAPKNLSHGDFLYYPEINRQDEIWVVVEMDDTKALWSAQDESKYGKDEIPQMIAAKIESPCKFYSNELRKSVIRCIGLTPFVHQDDLQKITGGRVITGDSCSLWRCLNDWVITTSDGTEIYLDEAPLTKYFSELLKKDRDQKCE